MTRKVLTFPGQEKDRRRRESLARYAILDTPREADFDDIVALASAACGMPVALISLLDGHRQWFKAETGLGRNETPLSSSICAHAVEQRDLFIIPDTTKDARTAGNPLVTGERHIRFYAGMPLETPDGTALGTLCVLDTKPNALTPVQALTLRTLARQVMTQLELRRALKERRESDRRNAAILESAVDYGIIAMDLTGHVTSWSAGAERILGWTEAEMIGRHANVFFTSRDEADGVAEREMGAALLHGRGSDERWHKRRDGSTFWASGEMMPLRDAHGTPEGFIKILRDRTAERLAAERQRADAAFMRGVLASSNDCIKVLDLDANLTFMSEGGLRVMEVSDFSAIRGCPWPDFWEAQGNRDARAAVAAAKAGGVGRFQGTARTMAGHLRWWDVQVTPIRDAEGRPERLLSVSRDITVQKAAEQDVVASGQRWRDLFTGMQEGFFLGEIVRDAGGRPVDYRFLEINPAFAAQSGLPVDSIGRTMRSLVPDIPLWLIDTYARIVDTGEPRLFEVQVPELHRWFEVRARKDAGQRFTCLFLDITDRKRTETRRAAMIALGDRLRDVSDAAAIGPIVGEILGRTLDLSHAGYAAVDPERETVTVAQGWTAPGLTSLTGLHHLREYGSYVDDLKAGTTVLIEDVRQDPRTEGERARMAAIDVVSLVNMPILERGRFVTLFFALKSVPHAWAPEEVAFLRNVADRARAAVARLEAEEQQRVLNLELSHRMRNTLAMVQSIANQTMRGATDVETARNVLAARLVALGRSHDLLLGGAIGSTGLTALVASAVELHRDRPERFLLEGPDLAVGPKCALSLSLMLHELATNAAKYGALSLPTGQVSVVWSLRPGDGETRLHLCWSEAGGPLVAAPTRTGFGTRLICRGLASNFDGAATLEYRATGVVCTITAPLSGLQAEDAPSRGR
ncbi:hypothetical protein OPKNFCMD_2742 [Methylobacterium crusticola]|uniref:Blue-light-activated histidine kinase n=1 Tax=Methylobacterium crusticola TaxID=1697972 RepID=A0ABQ4QY82_9HYPH|nr:PAS domain-containing protein [Methylobacterium crusticola]GJD50006.1 hypothetical protein OPKNFCMD_2742 [Methylobacterium crusticola]